MAKRPEPSPLPLEGVRVLDLSRVFAGPLCGQVLADFGAEVIKVEHPQRGDDTRDWGQRIGATETTYFYSMNRNKRSITVDLQQPAGQALIHRLVPHCDVVIQNFKTGGAEGLGVGFEQLKALRPDLIYCSVSGYATHTPEASRPGYDLVIQAEAGLMAMNGEPDQPPLKFGMAVVDMVTGMNAAQAVLAALFQRSRTGQGRLLELALYDCGLSITSYCGLDALWQGQDPPRYGNAHPSIVPYGLFESADGPLIIAVGNNRQFQKFCSEVLQRPDLLTDPRFATNTARAQHRQALLATVQALVAQAPRAQLLQRLTQHGIPCGEVAGLHQALSSPRTQHSGVVQRCQHPQAGEVPVLASPVRLDGQRLPLRHAPPVLGEATHELLQSLLGLGDEALADLAQQGVIGGPSAHAISE